MFKLAFPRWMRRRAGRHATPCVQEAAAALRAEGTMVTPCGDEFQHWRMGDFIMTEAAVIHFAVSRGLIADR